MIRRFHHVLAVAILDERIVCAEAAGRGGASRVQRAHSMPLTPDATLDQPEALGAQLAAFIRAQGFHAKHAVVGVPAKWLLAQERELPPVAAAEAAGLLRLQAEKLAVSDAAEFVFDYVGNPSPDRPTRALIVGMLCKRLAQIETMAGAAGLRVQAVTPTALAVAQSLGGEGPLLMLSGRGAEVVWRTAEAPRAIQHVPVSLNGHGRSLSMLGVELRRGATLGGAARPGGSRDAMLVDAIGFPQTELDQLGRTVGLNLQRPPEAVLTQAEPVETFPAVALARAATADAGLAADFTHSRLAQQPPRRLSRPVAWAAALGLLAVIAIGAEVLDFQSQRSELASLEEQAARIAPDVADAEASIARTTFGRGFFENRAAALDVLLALSRAFGETEPVWTTSLTLRDNGKAQLMGGARSQEAVLALLDRMKKEPAFADVTLLDLRDATGSRDRETTFSITFTYRRTEGR